MHQQLEGRAPRALGGLRNFIGVAPLRLHNFQKRDRCEKAMRGRIAPQSTPCEIDCGVHYISRNALGVRTRPRVAFIIEKRNEAYA